MEPILQWGLEFIRIVQTAASPSLTAVMRIITAIGETAVYLAAVPLIYWCVDEKKGLRLGIMVLISIWINLSLKYLFDQPRPFFEGYDPSVGMASEKTGGLPSGHAQNTLVMFFILASLVKKKWAYVCAGVLCLLIGFSRIYLGVHFPTDVLAGWILGGVILGGYFLLSGKIEELLVKGGFRAGMIATAALSFVMILYIPVKELLMPGGTLLGLGFGYCYNRRSVGFSNNALPEMADQKKYLILFARIILGLGGLILIFFRVSSFVPHSSSNQNLYGFAVSMITGLWISIAAPWIFIKLHLAGSEIKSDE
jgi:membrane-associated phospholipid phosphatase